MTDPGVKSLRDEISEITDRLNRLSGYDEWLDVSGHNDRIERLEERVGHHSVSDLAEDLDRLRELVEEATSDTGQAATATQTLAERVRLMERRLRVSAQIPTVDLDQWPQGLMTLVKTVRAGRDAEADVLYVGRQNQLQGFIQWPDKLRETIRGHQAAAAEAARRLAELDPAAPGWNAATRAWNSAIIDMKKVDEQLDEATERAATARENLAAANSLDKVAAPKVQRGKEAVAGLHTRIRTRISEAVRDDKLFPAWFETILGGGAPATGTARWLDLAVRVVTYRLVADVTDPVLALGDRPEVNAGWRRQDYDTLTRECRTMR